ncbi:MAG: TMEM165/GDT1 family protein [Aquincola sp.]|nr:TMEM165/GDT1 family protein [Aquincola sp.]MDH4289331.1 TMEM165/GDT1 family protein [Aquincola sp.]MDH5328607.1 TMEM165/GDT1 family protein [Aquincola sp.]
MTFEAFAVSTGVVALGEMGDKTQLLALVLAARYRAPWPIISGILVATLANHLGAAALGTWLTRVIDPDRMRWVLGASFLAVALWMLVPDRPDESKDRRLGRLGVFGLTTVAFFLVEMGDKTQIATVMLAARYDAVFIVTAGTTLGMLAANVPAVLLGDRIVQRVPIAWVHRIAAIAFASIGVAILAGLHV